MKKTMSITSQRFLGCSLMFSLGVIPAYGGAALDEVPAEGPAFAYHVRVVRVGTGETEPGAAIGWGSDSGTPVIVPSEEVWGTPEQLESLEELLGVERAEAVTGFFVQADDENAFEFQRTVYIGETVVELSFNAVPPPEGGRAHRVALRIVDTATPVPPLAEANMLLATDRSVALAVPGLPGGDWVVLAVTPLEPSEATRRIRRATAAVAPHGDNLVPPRVVNKVPPRYPEGARKDRITGEVVVQAVIDREGIPRAPMVVRMTPGCEELAGAAVEAVQQWRYEPARLDGEPVAVWFSVAVRFALE